MERPNPQHGTQTETFIARIIAFLIDGLVLGAIAIAIIGIFTAISPRLASLGGVLYGFGAILYFIYLEGAYGQTIGKRAMGIVVVKSDGSRNTMTASAIRNILRIIDTLPTLYIIGIILILISEDNQRLGDMLGNTVVMKTSS
ncbi:RDD family protein [Halodesulfurarchaeum sp.]|uniref:RDD family protein n=1 Tax=Halodesulfurarchaeum sp. TaxID=1980530 RepID=UPI001BBF6EA8|nr:RDD family protein [Halodesulfurarchaeum sp.]